MERSDYGYYTSNYNNYSATSSRSESTEVPKAQRTIRRKKSSEKERIRNQEIKKVLEEIRKRMPHVNCKDLSRIRTLRLATEYIRHLQRVLNGDMVRCGNTWRSLTLDDFQQVVAQEMQITNSYKERADLEMQQGISTDPTTSTPTSFHSLPPRSY